MSIITKMKKMVIFIVGCLFLLASSPIYAVVTSRVELQQRLMNITDFSANFKQIVKNSHGDILQEGNGTLLLKRPYFFKWQLYEPDEMLIISNGKTVWMYTAPLEQVTLMNREDVIGNQLFVLLTDSNHLSWQDYDVIKQGDKFILKPNRAQAQYFEISISQAGRLSGFSIIEEDEQRSEYQFSKQKLSRLSEGFFTFATPKGVTIDDQR